MSVEGGRYLQGVTKSTSRESPLISVLIVTYNARQYLQEALESVFDQTYENIELIVVDGDSNDGTKKILKNQDRIDYWVSEPDIGQANAFNKGFRLCTGELLTWLNADEVYLSTAIDAVAERFKQNRHLKWFSAGIIFTDNNLKITKMRKGEDGQRLLKRFGILNIYGSSSFFTKDLFLRAGEMNEQLHYTMDTDLWWRFLNLGESFYRVAHYLTLYRIHENSKTGSYTLNANRRKPDHQAEVDRIHRCYQYRPKSMLGFRAGKIIRNTLRLCSYNYLSSLIDSVRYKGMNAKDVFK